MIYYVEDVETHLVKIGWSWNPKQRRPGLEWEYGATLVLIATEDGKLKREQELHRRFSGSHHCGEWFHPTEELRAHIATLGGTLSADPPSKPPRPYDRRPYKRAPVEPSAALLSLVEKQGGGAEFARKIGVSRQSLNRLTKGRSDIGAAIALKIYAATGVKLGPMENGAGK